MFCYQKSFVNPTLPVDEQQFYALVRAKQWNDNIDKYRETGEASLKRKLPAFIFQAMFDETQSKNGKVGRWRKQAATRLTGLVVMDVDHIDDPVGVFNRIVERLFRPPLAPPDSGGESTTDSSSPESIGESTTQNSSPESGEARRGLNEALQKDGQRDFRPPLTPPDSGGESGSSSPESIGESTTQNSSPESGEVRRGLNDLGILLVYVTPSGHGLKIVFKADARKGNLIDNQHAMAEVLGVEVDESCKDASRMSFICKESDILYLDKELFTYENKEFAEKYDAEYRAGHSAPSRPQGEESAAEPSTPSLQEGQGVGLWRGYDVQSIIDARYGEKLPCKADSNRHNESLKLASDLLVLFDGDRQKTLQALKAQKWVQEIIDERDENVEQTVASAAERMAEKEKKYGGNIKPSKAMQEAVLQATGLTYDVIISPPESGGHPSHHSPPESGGGRGGLNKPQDTRPFRPLLTSPDSGEESTAHNSPPESGGEMDTLLNDWGAQIEALFADFPLLRDICKGLKKNQFTAALFVAGGLLMTLMTRCTYRFYHRPEELRRLNNSTLIIGDPASGKSFATRLFKLLAAPMVAADKAGIAAINRYKEEMKTKGANKEKPQKPKALFRVHPARTSNAQFIQDMVNAVEVVDGEEMQLHMLTFDTELDNTLTVQKGGSWIDKQSLELKAFHNEEDGQAYSNLDSVVQNFFVTWNYIYTGTPIALKKKVNERNFGSGLATRLTCIPLPSTNFEMMERERTVDFESDGRLKAWAFKLDRMKGILSLDKIVDELYDWTARRMMDAKENNSKADEMLLKRCAYHGLNFAAPFIVMRHWQQIHQEGNYWCGEFETDDVDWRLTELLVNIQYACQRHYFGAMAEKYFDDQKRDVSANSRRQQKTIEAFNRLPEEFTADDIMRCFGLEGESSARGRARTLIADHLAVKTGEYKDNGKVKSMYRKTGTVML